MPISNHRNCLPISTGFNVDPNSDPAFYLKNADPDPGSQTNANPDPDPGQTLQSQKVESRYIGNKAKKIYEGTKTFLKGRKPGQSQCSWIRIRITNTYPDPGQPNQRGSGSSTVLIRQTDAK
jgi:hypothetical protein